MRVILYTGKGGVGKTTTSAATAVRAAETGRRALVVSADPAHSLGDVLGVRLSGEPQRLADGLEAVEVDARLELARHWGSIRDYLVSLFRYQGIEEVVAEELALLPGAEELATLTAVDQFARSERYDVIVVDCAPTDSTLRLVTLPEVSHSAIRLLLKMQRAIASVVTPLAAGVVPVPLPEAQVFRDAEQLLYRTLRRLRERLLDPETSVRLVVTPERMVIDEARRAGRDLSLFEVRCDAVVMNRVLPEAAAAEDFFRDWVRVQREHLQGVAASFAPLPLLTAPLQDDEVVGLARLSEHAAALFEDHEVTALLYAGPGVRFRTIDEGFRVTIPLPGASARDVDVAVVDEELVLRVGSQRRALVLPDSVAAASLAGARVRDGELVVDFEAGGR